MKHLKPIRLASLFMVATVTATGAQPFRTNINPALLYYQSFVVAPNLSQADSDHLFTNEWRGQRLPERFGRLVSRYDTQFRVLRQAAQARVPCDWGIDMSAGPDSTLLPCLARAKAVTQAARLRVMWHLQRDEEEKAVDDLLAALALARQTTRDGTLMSVLLQMANEATICTTVAENFGEFTPETLKRLVDGFDTPPVRGTVAESILAERGVFLDSIVERILALQKQNPGNDTQVMAEVRKLFGTEVHPADGGTNRVEYDFADEVGEAAGGTSDGVIKLVRDARKLYERLAAIAVLPHREYETLVQRLSEEIERTPNPIFLSAFSAFKPARQRESRMQAYLAMVRAAVEYKLHGEPGLSRVIDPCGEGPFAFERFVFNGTDRGFKLTSALQIPRLPTQLIFIEKSGPPVRVDGPRAGQALTAPAAEK